MYCSGSPFLPKTHFPKTRTMIQQSDYQKREAQVLMWQEEDQVAAAASLLLAVSATLQCGELAKIGHNSSHSG
jgi:hypothetical protein